MHQVHASGIRVLATTARWRRVVLAGVALLGSLAAGCRGAAPELPDRWQLALAPASFGRALSLQQHVQVEQGAQKADFEAVLDITPDTVTLVGLAFSQRVFTLKYDGVKLQESRSRMLPKEVRAADVLSDLQLALWPADVVQRALPAGYALRDSSGTRTLFEGDSLRSTISYTGSPRWAGTITLQNVQYNYRLTIRSAVVD